MPGTFIDQGQTPEFYFQNYPEDHPVLGFFTWRWIFFLGFDHMFSSPIFLGMLALLGASLMACTYTTQIPLIKVSRRFGCQFSVFIMLGLGNFLIAQGLICFVDGRLCTRPRLFVSRNFQNHCQEHQYKMLVLY